MSFLNFMEQKAEEKGLAACPNCGVPDIFFSLVNKCTECDNPIRDKPQIEKLQFSIELLIEFTEKYDEFMPAENKKIFAQLGKAIAYKIKQAGTIDNTKLIHFQYFCKHIPILGSNEFGGAVDGTKMGIQMVETARAEMNVAKTLSAVLLSLQYIREYKVPNEYILETPPSQNKPVQKEVPPIVNTTSKSTGCLGTFLILTFILASIIYSIF